VDMHQVGNTLQYVYVVAKCVYVVGRLLWRFTSAAML
jgi:hypothetical protein